MADPITRLAPSPTGSLHLGNARTFLLNYLLAKTRGWRVLMRIEDLDGPRIKAGATAQAIDELAWLGLTWEEPIVYQSQRELIYQSALEQLIATGAAYPCTCSRKDVQLAAGAPHMDDPVVLYQGTCRGKWATADHAAKKTGRAVAWRVHVDNTPITIADKFAGDTQFVLGETCGDFVVFRNEGLSSYQLAVVLDDADAGVDRIVRGDDLLESAARQSHLRKLLGVFPDPEYWHFPLVVGTDGRRLAKRHGDTRMDRYRHAGVTTRRVLGLLGYWCGLLDERRPAEIDELIDKFDIAKVLTEQIVFTAVDDAYLTSE